jgi:ethanolamine kinase
MGSEGRSWSGAAAVGGGVEGEAAIAAVVAPAPGDVPASGASVDIALPLPEMTPRIIGICKELVRGWSSLDSSRFSIETVSGGITNMCESLLLGSFMACRVVLNFFFFFLFHLSNSL